MRTPPMHSLLAHPRHALEAAVPLATSAITNARAAVETITADVATRLKLTSLIEVGAEATEEPGQLTQLSIEECAALLSTKRIGRLCYIARASTPDVAPVNFTLDGRFILIASGPGPKLQAAERGDTVAFEVDDLDEATQDGWSVVVYGRATRLSESKAAKAVARSGHPRPWAVGPRDAIIAIEMTRVTGRWLG